jgi:superfamily I DNA/RNA helicase
VQKPLRCGVEEGGRTPVVAARRLLYVGMTRAGRHLVLTYPERERGYNRRPSPFLDAAPERLLHVTEDNGSS